MNREWNGETRFVQNIKMRKITKEDGEKEENADKEDNEDKDNEDKTTEDAIKDENNEKS